MGCATHLPLAGCELAAARLARAPRVVPADRRARAGDRAQRHRHQRVASVRDLAVARRAGLRLRGDRHHAGRGDGWCCDRPRRPQPASPRSARAWHLLLLAGFALPAVWLALGSGGLLPFRVTRDRLVGAAIVCVAMLVIASWAFASTRPACAGARSTRRPPPPARDPALRGRRVGALGLQPHRDVQAQRIIEALNAYYQKEQTYPDELEELVKAGLLPVSGARDRLPAGGPRRAGLHLPGLRHELPARVLRAALGAVRLQPALPRRREGDGEPGRRGFGGRRGGRHDAESGGGAWSCPSKPPELW